MTIQFRLTSWIITIILIANSLLAVVTAIWVGNVLIDEVQTRVRLDLNSAHRVYNDYIESIERSLRGLSVQFTVDDNNPADLRNNLDTAYRSLEQPFDVFLCVGLDGTVLYRANNPSVVGDDMRENLIIAQALERQEPVSGTLIVSRDSLVREGTELMRQAFIEVRDTPAAAPSDTTMVINGMMIAAAVPLRGRGPDRKMIGVVYGALLLNRRYEIVDTIRNENFQSQIQDGQNRGMATIFMGDVRISTNVLSRDGSRAIGTRLSAEVYKKVLQQGEIWARRAFVVNDWYITAYEPIHDPNQKIIGALYVGLLEKPFLRTRNMILAFFFFVVAVTTLLSLLLLGWVTRWILRPIAPIIRMAHRVIQGDLCARVDINPPGEMGDLCRVINQMADAVDQREQQLKQSTRQQIGQSEKLASIGRLAAGIAHEINNPLTGVLTFAHLLRQNERFEEQDRQDLDVIIQETTRVREIVRGLLDFARESPSTHVLLNVSDVIRQTIKLVRSQKEFRRITITEQLDDGLPEIKADRNQLQQVLLNLSLNACEAMPEGGELTVSTMLFKDSHVQITVRDTGCGIEPDHLEKIFDPFFTTKPVGKGTGLGLSVSYGIIQSHGGDIHVESELGQGTVFSLLLPLNAAESC